MMFLTSTLLWAGDKSDLVKAGIVLKLDKFIHFAENNIACHGKKMAPIQVIGKSDLTKAIKALATKSSTDKSNLPAIITDLQALQPCSLLVIAPTDQATLANIIAVAKEKSVLTVSDQEGYGVMGVVFNFFIVNNKVKFEINKSISDEEKLSISYKLLQLATLLE